MFLSRFLLKKLFRSLKKDGQVFSPDVKKFIHETLHLPKSFDDENSFTIGGGKTKLLGSSQTRVLNLDEEIALMNFLKMHRCWCSKFLNDYSRVTHFTEEQVFTSKNLLGYPVFYFRYSDDSLGYRFLACTRGKLIFPTT